MTIPALILACLTAAAAARCLSRSLAAAEMGDLPGSERWHRRALWPGLACAAAISIAIAGWLMRLAVTPWPL
ncbi:MAG: hypothetical protein GY717_16950 [Rhodobacteraceae bacterium]|nr:hypothetical protein [Paracoccaceae bacterium]